MKRTPGRIHQFCLTLLFLMASLGAGAAPDNRTKLDGLKQIRVADWSHAHVRRVLQAFAYGGQATDQQIDQWASMKPGKAVRQMLKFRPVNLRLSPQGANDPSRLRCDSLEEMQDFWSSDKNRNPMRVANRPWYATLAQEQNIVSPLNLYLAWSRAAHSPGCNTFLHKTVLYITNYHAAIHIQNTAPTLIRSYYDDVLGALSKRQDFVEVMTLAASHAALARAYGHMENRFDDLGQFQGNDDFAREYFQLLFGIQGSTEDPDYHENVTIEHNAWLLTGMALDAELNAWGSESPNDWLLSPIQFTNHFDPVGRFLPNQAWHFESFKGAQSCLEILHTDICGPNARAKLKALGPVAAAHPESLASVPLKLIRFFGDDVLDESEAEALQSAWVDAGFDMLVFLRAYAVSTLFHASTAFKLRSAFDRNLLIHNANQLTAEEAYAELFFEGPIERMFNQGALVFAPIRDVFGGQTGADAANDRYVFKKAWDGNVNNPEFLAKASELYQPKPDAEALEWVKNWGATIPVNDQGQHTVAAVGAWLWDHFIGDGGANYDLVAQAQVHALLATGFDFGALMDGDSLDTVYFSDDLESGAAAEMSQQLGADLMSLEGIEGNHRVGMAINFITALPYTFVTGGQP